MTAERDVAGAIVGGIPVRWVVAPEPPPGEAPRRVALFLPFLGGDTGRVTPMLERLAGAGFFAVSFDPWQHGARATESPEQLRDRMLANFRRDMWPVIGQTTLEAMGVLDWVTAHHDVAPDGIVAGGLSMGGDIAVALAGADHRIARVAALGSTPDWTRPGMRDLGGNGALVGQGTPGAYGHWLYEQLDPVTHLDHYAHGPAILFEGSQADGHVPMEAAYRFATALADRSPAAGKNISVRATGNLGHRDAVSNPDAVDRCLAWLAAD